MTDVGERRHPGDDLGGHTFAFAHDAEEDVLGTDVVVTEGHRLPQRELQDVLRARCERRCAEALSPRLQRGLEGAVAERLLDMATDLVEVDADGRD